MFAMIKSKLNLKFNMMKGKLMMMMMRMKRCTPIGAVRSCRLLKHRREQLLLLLLLFAQIRVGVGEGRGGRRRGC